MGRLISALIGARIKGRGKFACVELRGIRRDTRTFSRARIPAVEIITRA